MINLFVELHISVSILTKIKWKQNLYLRIVFFLHVHIENQHLHRSAFDSNVDLSIHQYVRQNRNSSTVLNSWNFSYKRNIFTGYVKFSMRAILIMLLQCTTHIPWMQTIALLRNVNYMLITMAESKDLVDVWRE